jgi:hypothetical protein
VELSASNVNHQNYSTEPVNTMLQHNKERRGGTGGGVAIIVKNGLKYQRMKNLYNHEGKLIVQSMLLR